MTTRIWAVVVFTIGVCGLVLALTLVNRIPGMPEDAAHLRAMKDRDRAPTSTVRWHMNDFEMLPHRAPDPGTRALERTGVVMEGYVQRMLLSGDGDLHLEIAEHPRGPNDRDTAYVVGEVTPAWRDRGAGWSYDSLLVVFRPNRGGPSAWSTGPRRVRVGGWLTYDHPYDARVNSWMLLHESTRVTGWEIHPVTSIEWWDEVRQRWREVRP